MPSYPIPSCPETIVGPNANGFSLAPKKAKDGMRTEMGSTRTRRFNTSNVYVIEAEFNFFSTAKFTEFLTWLKYETNYGNMWFKADWFSDLGFTSGDWVFRFVNLPFSNTGYSQLHGATLLMAPYNDNVVSANYTELGVGGDFIDEDFPFGYETYECTDDLTFNRLAYADQDNFLRVFDWNGSNFTKVGQDYTLPAFTTYGLTYLKKDLVAYIDRNSTGTGNYGGPGAKLQAYSFNNDVWVTVGSSLLIGVGDSVDFLSITALSQTRVAVCYDRTSFFGAREVKLATYDFNGSSWALVGSVFTVISAGFTPSVTKLSSTTIALTYGVTGFIKLGKFTFSGSSWSLTGTLFSSSTLNGFPVISAMTSSQVAYADANYKLRYLTFSGSTWTLQSGNLASAGDVVSAIASDKVSVVHGALGKITLYKLTAGAWTQVGNEFYDYIGTLYPRTCAYYEF